jgi:hypothetical protein
LTRKSGEWKLCEEIRDFAVYAQLQKWRSCLAPIGRFQGAALDFNTADTALRCLLVKRNGKETDNGQALRNQPEWMCHSIKTYWTVNLGRTT